MGLRHSALVVAIAASGCAYPSRPAHDASKVVAGFGVVSLVIATGALFVGGIASLPWGDCGDGGGMCDDPAGPFHTAKVFGLIGGSLLLLGGLGTSIFDPGRDPLEKASADGESALRVHRQNRIDAQSLTRVAVDAARAGDCSMVARYHEQVLYLDREVHATVFAQDAGIRWCLQRSGIDVPPALPPPPAPPVDPAAQQRSRIKDREQAFALTKTATTAAKAGDCDTARELEPKVRSLDANVHTAWFLRDDAIKACLAPKPAPLEAAP